MYSFWMIPVWIDLQLYNGYLYVLY
jgi:hypothetical protein